MATKIFIYGVDQNMPDADLQGEFSKFGQVTDVYNSTKGYAFVTFSNKEEAANAISVRTKLQLI